MMLQIIENALTVDRWQPCDMASVPLGQAKAHRNYVHGP